MATTLEFIRRCLDSFSDEFTNRIDEHSSTESHIVVRTNASSKEQVWQWFGEFASVAGMSYVVNKIFKEGASKKAFPEEYICHHSNRNKLVKCDSKRLVEHKQKATGCQQRTYVSIQRRTVDVLCYEKKQGKDFVASGLVATITFTGVQNHKIQTADSSRYPPTLASTKATILDKFKQVTLISVPSICCVATCSYCLM